MAKQKKEQKDQPFEKTLWQAADKLRKNMDAAEYKHIVMGLIFLKYISDAFKEMYDKLKATKGADPEDPDEYRAESVFFVPPQARWDYLLSQARQSTIGTSVDDAMDAIEKQNPTLKGVLPKQYARTNLDKSSLGGLIDLIGNISLGDELSKSRDILGRVYEYFLGQFALAEGKKGGQFYTPRSIVTLLTEILEPFKGRVFDPCCGSGGMFVQSEKFVLAHQGKIDDISIFGQESNQTTYRLCRMNLTLRGIDSSNIRWNNEGSFLNDAHLDLKADFIIANPPFNDSDWSGDQLRKDGRWKYGVPPEGNANFAWVQHFIYHLAPEGIAGFVLGNSSLSATNTGDGNIRQSIIEADLLDCIVALPNRLFYNTSIPACLWFVTRNKKASKKHRNRTNEVLLIDARKKGFLEDKNQRILLDEDINFIKSTYHSWKSNNSKYKDIPGFCKSVKIGQIAEKDFNLSPNKYIDLETDLKVKINFQASIDQLINKIGKEQEHRISLQREIQKTFSNIGYTALSKLNFSNLNTNSLIEISKTLFHYWFIDFEFPNKRGKPYKSNGGTFYETTLGKIPVGWDVETLSNAAYVIDCLHSKKPEQIISDTGRLLLMLYNIADDGILDLTDKFFISETDYQHWIKNIEAIEGDCVITNTGRIGAVAQIPFYGKFAIGRNMTAVRPKKEKILPAYLMNYLLSPYMQIETYRETDIGTILDSLNVKGIKKVKILLPEKSVLEMFESFAKPIRTLIEINSTEAMTRRHSVLNEEVLVEEDSNE